MKIKQIVRFNTWWNFILPPLLAFIYLFLLLFDIHWAEALFITGLFLVWMIGAASFGYFVNDLCDVKMDALADKKNETHQLSIPVKIVIIALSLGIAFTPWVLLSDSIFVFGLVIFHLILLVIYSAPPIRLKKTMYLGMICDTLYSILIPLLIVIATFSGIHENPPLFILSGTILLWSFLKGFRNILLHQLDDKKNDAKAGHYTFVHKIGPVRVLNCINFFILPFEFIVLSFLCVYLSFEIDFFFIGFGIFLVFTFLKFNLWKIFSIRPRQLKFRFLYFLNDFYEEWLPIIALIFLALHKLEFVIFLVLHILLFPQKIVKLYGTITQKKAIFSKLWK